MLSLIYANQLKKNLAQKVTNVVCNLKGFQWWDNQLHNIMTQNP